MTVIRRFVDSFMSIVKGRALTPEDSESGRAVCVISRELSEEFGLDVGDSVPLKLGTVFFEQYKGLGAVAGTRERYSPAETDVELEIVGIYADTDPDIEDILALYSGKIRKDADSLSRKATIAGIVSSPSGRHGRCIFLSGIADDKIDFAEFTLSDNFRVDEFRRHGAGMAGGSIVFYLDTAKLESPMATYRLMESLYPGTVAEALLIGGFVCWLIILQSSKEAAIMRALGTTKARTRAALSLEQVLVGIAGLAAGTCAALAYNPGGMDQIVSQLGMYALLYIATLLVLSVACSVFSTRRSVLTLLQVRE